MNLRTPPKQLRLILLLAAVLTLVLNSQKTPNKNTHHLEPLIAQSGDLIYRRGEGFISDFAANLSSGEKIFSHVGILIKEGNNISVIHAIKDSHNGFNGVVQQNLDAFLGKTERWALYRMKISPLEQAKIVELAKSYLNDETVTFDTEFDLATSNKIYCTELIWRVFQETSLATKIKFKTKLLNKPAISISDTYQHEQSYLVSSTPK